MHDINADLKDHQRLSLIDELVTMELIDILTVIAGCAAGFAAVFFLLAVAGGKI